MGKDQASKPDTSGESGQGHGSSRSLKRGAKSLTRGTRGTMDCVQTIINPEPEHHRQNREAYQIEMMPEDVPKAKCPNGPECYREKGNCRQSNPPPERQQHGSKNEQE